jgi:predicted amidophosphoribosyltransferase
MTSFRVAWAAWLVDLLFPSRCVSCGASATVLCESCLASLRRLDPPLCDRCGAPTVWPVARCRECTGRRLGFVSARAAVAYTGAARAVMAAWKEHGLRRAGQMAAGLVTAQVARPAADVITYIPADQDRLLRRGHHPAELLGGLLAQAWHLDAAELLRRTDGTSGGRQTGLSRPDRLRNARGAFVALTRVPPRVLLVDDVYTTGATAAAAATALRHAGARRVEVVTFARTVRL